MHSACNIAINSRLLHLWHGPISSFEKAEKAGPGGIIIMITSDFGCRESLLVENTV